MNRIPKKLNDQINANPFYARCAREHHGGCGGRITREHAIIYAGRQVQEMWAIIPLCERHHAVGMYQDSGDLDKRFNEWVALSRMTEEDMAKYPKRNWQQQLDNLNRVYLKANLPVIERLLNE